MKIDVAFAPGVMPAAPVTVVVDVIRATTTITHAVGHGYSRVLACGDIDQARELGRRLANGAVLAGVSGVYPLEKCAQEQGHGFAPTLVGASRAATPIYRAT